MAPADPSASCMQQNEAQTGGEEHRAESNLVVRRWVSRVKKLSRLGIQLAWEDGSDVEAPSGELTWNHLSCTQSFPFLTRSSFLGFSRRSHDPSTSSWPLNERAAPSPLAVSVDGFVVAAASRLGGAAGSNWSCVFREPRDSQHDVVRPAPPASWLGSSCGRTDEAAVFH
jgi:hypothetical protein